MGSKFFLAACAAVQFLAISAQAATVTVVAPEFLAVGATVSPIPNGFSSGDGTPVIKPYDNTQAFVFGGLSGKLRERVLDYSDRPSTNHPGLYFDFEIQLLAGTISAFSISGYSSYDTFVKECGISGCGGSGANGVAATSVSRSSNGDVLTFDFGNLLTAGHHSANLQIFSNAAFFKDPPAFLIDGSGNSFTVDVVAPSAAPVPGPIVGAGIPGIVMAIGCLLAWRRRKANA